MADMFIRKRNKHNRKQTAAECILLFAMLALASCSLIPESITSRFTGKQDTIQNVQQEILVPVTRGSISASLSFVGNLRYKQSSELTWKTNGVIDKVYVKVGDSVKKDDILAELDPDYLSSTILLAEKNMIDGQERLEDVMESESSRMQAYVDLNIKENSLVQAKLAQEALYYPRATRYEMERAWDAYALANLNFNYAKQDYDHLVASGQGWEGFEEGREVRGFGGNTFIIGKDSRSARERKFEDYVSAYNTLVSAYEKYVWTSGKPSATDYAVAEGNVQVAQKEYDKALETYRSYESIPREKDVQAAEISLNSAEMVYKQRYIYAPFDGVVTAVNAVESYYITRGTNAVRMDDMSAIYIPLNISELDISRVAEGTPVKIVVDAAEGKTFTGYVYDVSEASAASGNTTSFSALIAFDSPESGLLAGMTAEVSIPVDEKNNVLLIPGEAVTYDADGKPGVTIVNGSTRQTVMITSGIVSGNIMEVVSDNIHEGDLLSVSSISAESLTKLGLNPSDYSGGGRQMPQDYGTGRSGFAPEMQQETAAVESVKPTADSSAIEPVVSDSSAQKVSDPDATATVIDNANLSGTGRDRFRESAPDGQFPGRQGDSRPENGGTGTGQGRSGRPQRPDGNENSQNQQENVTPQPTRTDESNENSEKG